MANDLLDRIEDYWLTLPDGRKIPYGIGCAWLGRRGLNPDRIARDVNVLDEAYACGFRYFDTSSAYGESEIVTGKFIRHVPRESVFLTTKSMVPAGISTKVAAKVVRINLEASLERLQTEYIDTFQMHEITTLDQLLSEDGILPILVKAKQEGRIRNIGIATRHLGVLEAAASHGAIDSLLTYSDYTPIDQSAERLLEVAARHGVGIVNASPLSASLLTDRDPEDFDTNDEEEFAKRKSIAIDLNRIVKATNESMLKFALHFPIGQPKIHITLTGPASVKELHSTLDSLQAEVSPRLWEKFAVWNAQASAKT
jgi:L-galactose dehydrogenase